MLIQILLAIFDASEKSREVLRKAVKKETVKDGQERKNNTRKMLIRL